jgi:hypothetical protein
MLILFYCFRFWVCAQRAAHWELTISIGQARQPACAGTPRLLQLKK